MGLKYILLAIALLAIGSSSTAHVAAGCGAATIVPSLVNNAPEVSANPPCLQNTNGTAMLRSRRLVANAPKPAQSLVPLAGVLDEGDSISVFWGGNHTGIYAATHPKIIFYGMARGGSWISGTADGNDITARFPIDVMKHPAFVTLLIGGNDISSVGPYARYKTVSAWLDSLFAYTDKWKATGAKVLVGTILPQCIKGDPNGVNEAVNANRVIANAAIRASVGTKIDAVVDYAADPTLGPDKAACDLKIFSDGLHPTDGAANGTGGQGRMFQIYAAMLDKLMAAPVPSPTSVSQIPSNFDRSTYLLPAAIPPSAAPDNVGAFRFICTTSHESYDDPVVYPGQPGKSHLHEFFGNTGTNAASTFASLRTSGDSTCGNKLNRSGYWQPAMLNGLGQVVRPDYWTIYYKRLPASSSDCAKIAQRCAAVPAGLRFIFGYDMLTMTPPTGDLYFACVGPRGLKATGGGPDMAVAIQGCAAPSQLEVRLHAPDCWDGENLDSPNHRDHIGFSKYGQDGQLHCDAAHPVEIPTFTLAAFYTVDGTLPGWHFSSDEVMKAKAGSTFHADFFSAWDDATEAAWTANCIDKMLNCNGGNLGDGTMLKPNPSFSWTANPRLVPLPNTTALRQR